MFIGHFAVGFAAKRVAPRASLGSYIAATIFLDMLWPVFLLVGIEQVRIAPGITAFTPFDFVHYPWSHSLLMAGFWAMIFGGAHYLFRRDGTTARMLGVVVFSHWILDWVSHRPDLQLAPGFAFRTGLSLWNSIPATVAVEGTMFLAAAWWYERATEALDGIGRWAWYGLITLLLFAYGASLGPPPREGQETMVAFVGIAAWLFVPWAAWTDRHRVFHK
jgi:membrane-bound metal-dependent hydrolase YbcI (DUF457 family)